MNTFLETNLSSRTTSQAGHIGELKTGGISALKRLWRLADLRTLITFITGVLTGLLIPLDDWPAIFTVIVAGVVLRRVAKVIDEKCTDV